VETVVQQAGGEELASEGAFPGCTDAVWRNDQKPQPRSPACWRGFLLLAVAEIALGLGEEK
jgi:hypothetical protein